MSHCTVGNFLSVRPNGTTAQAMMVENPHLLLDSPWLWFDGCPSLSINLDAVCRSDVSRYVAQGTTQPESVDFVA